MILRDGTAFFSLDSRKVEAATDWCRAEIPLSLSPDELPRLAAGLQKLAEDGHGSFLWTNDGGEIRLETVMAKRGETHFSVRLQAPPDFLHELRLVLVGRQEELPTIADSLL